MLPGCRDAPLLIRQIRLDADGVWLDVEGTAARAPCPACGAVATRVHDRYQRRPQDLAWRGSPVRWALTVRRFRCPRLVCPRRTFAEPFGPALARYARRTAAAVALLLQLARELGGEAGARVAAGSGVAVSPDTLLRLLRRVGAPAVATPRVLGVDDLALRKRHRYATLLVDLETHRPVDLVDDRTAEVLAEWLRRHPGVETIVRDRSEAYAEGARVGAPSARQVADRFHLVQNSGAALEEVLRQRRRHLDADLVVEPLAPRDATLPPRPPSARERQRAAARAARVARWEAVRRRREAGESVLGIARALRMGTRTVRAYLASPEAPRRRLPVHGLASAAPDGSAVTSPSLQPYLPYLERRWAEGCHNLSRLWREVRAQGCSCSRSLVAQALLPWRGPRPPPAAASPRRRRGRRRYNLRWLCLRPPEQLDPNETAALRHVLDGDPFLARGYELAQRFRRLVAERDVAALPAWIADARGSSLTPFVALANGLVADGAAVAAALTTPWSTGPVEGHVCRVKLLKRQGFGRAKLDLLRLRVLAG